MKKNWRRNRPQRIQISEVLETRQLLAATLCSAASLNRNTRTLTITGAEDADRVSIQQNDAQRILFVTTGCGNSPDVRQQFPSQFVDSIMVQLSGGNDTFHYTTVSDLQFRKNIRLSLGSGDDNAFVRWAEDGGRARADLNLNVTGNAGSDAVGVRVGRVRSGVTTSISVDLGDGDDGFVAQVLNPATARANLSVTTLGGQGNDELQYFASGAMARRSAVNVRLDGQAGDDSAEVQNIGRIDGNITQMLTGGAGDDSISAALIDATGDGRYVVTSNGSAGDDTLITDLRMANRSRLSLESSINGGAGADQAISANPTILRNVEVVGPVTPQNRPIVAGAFDPVLPTSILRDSGRSIEYWTRGQSAPDAPIVVLVSGGGGDIDNWLPIASKLNGLGQVVSINKPGFGRTSLVLPANQKYSEAVVEDIRTVVRKLAPGRQVILVGHSLGGPYSNLYARRYPSEVAGVVFVDSTAPTRVDANDVAAEFGSPVYRVYPRGIQEELADIADSINAPLGAPEFPEIPVIALSQDLPPENLADAQKLANLGSPGRLQIVKNAGHYLQSDQPAIAAAAIREMVQKTQISGILSDVVAKYGIPGITASVVIGNQVLTGAAGVRAAGANSKVQVDDRFGMGSTTKAMTATLAGVLVDRGTLRWSSTISEVFPELKSTTRPEYRNVTLEQLLQHRGGIVADEDASEALGALVASYSGPAKLARQVLIPEVLKEKPAVAVGEFSYSNGGYAVAAAMMERAARVDYETLMNRHIFRPLGIRSATFDPKVSDPAHPKQPIGHLPDGTPAPGDKAPLAYLGKFLRPAGAELRMNVSDWSKFIRIHLGQTVNGVRLVRPETLTRLHRAIALTDSAAGVGYAMGWVVGSSEAAGLESGYGQVLNHNGSDGVWLSEVVAFPEVDFSIQILANATLDKQGNDLGAAAFTEIKQRLMHRFAPKPTMPNASQSQRQRQRSFSRRAIDIRM